MSCNEKEVLVRRFLLSVLLLAGFAVTCAGTAAAETELHMSNEFAATYNDVHGPGSASSSLSEGLRYLDVLNVYGSGTSGSVEYLFKAGGKATDDPRNDVRHFTLTNLNGRITNKIHTLTLGDTFESFSQYGLASAVKGGSYRYADPSWNSPEVTLVYGMAYPRWGNFWGEDAVERQVIGGRIKQGIADGLWAGFSGVKTIDHVRLGGSPLYDNSNWTADFEYRPIPGLTLNGEASFSNTDESQAGGIDLDYNGNAVKFLAVGDGDPSRVTLEYERISPTFLTLAGSATPDREKVKAKWRYKYAKDTTLNFGFLWYRDNLDGQKAFATNHYKPEAGITVSKLWGRQYSSSSLTYKLDNSHSRMNDTWDHFVNLNYRDRFGVFDSDTNLGYTHFDTKSARRGGEFTYNTSLNTRYTAGRFIFKPSLYLGGWSARDELANNNDQIYEYSLGLGAEVPDIKLTANLKGGQNRLVKDAGTDSTKTFASLNVFYRPKFLERLNQGMLFLKASVNDFGFSTSGRDFRESSVSAGINVQI